jgi:hypothetical protein
MEKQEMDALGMATGDVLLRAAQDVETAAEAGQLRKSMQPGSAQVAQSPLLRLLVRDHECGGDYADALHWLQNASPVIIEREIASVDATAPCSEVRLVPTPS